MTIYSHTHTYTVYTCFTIISQINFHTVLSYILVYASTSYCIFGKTESWTQPSIYNPFDNFFMSVHLDPRKKGIHFSFPLETSTFGGTSLFSLPMSCQLSICFTLWQESTAQRLIKRSHIAMKGCMDETTISVTNSVFVYQNHSRLNSVYRKCYISLFRSKNRKYTRRKVF